MTNIGESTEARAAARAAWPVRTYRLGEEPGNNLRDSTTPEVRLAMMWPLAVDSWKLAGMPLPDYTRAATPVRKLPPIVEE